MADDPNGPVSRAVSLDLTIPSDGRFRGTVRDLSARIAAHIGYTERDADEIGHAIERAVGGVMDYGSGGNARSSIQISYATNGPDLEIRVRYRAEAGQGRSALGEHVKRGLGERRAGEAPLESIQRVMKRVEFGRDDGGEFCRLTRPLPGPA